MHYSFDRVAEQSHFLPVPGGEPRAAVPAVERYPIPTIKGSSTRRFPVVLAVTLLAWVAGWPFLTLAFLNRYDSGEAAWIQELYRRKGLSLKRPTTGGGGRIIIVGGSGALFGIDAELIERKLGVTTVNYGTHAGLGGYILDRARSAARPGDTVLLCPEYELWYNKSADFSDVEWDYVSTYDKRYVWSHGVVPGLRTLYSQPGGAYQNALVGWQYRSTHIRKSIDPAPTPIDLDPCGDPRAMPPRLAFPNRGAAKFADPTDPGCAVDDYRAFASWARAKQVRVLYSWPNLCQQDWPRGAPPGAVAAPPSTRALLDELGFIAINEPSDTIYPRDWFTDTLYHPDAGCRRVRTEALIRRLRPFFGLPAVGPPPAASERESGIYLIGGGTNWLRPGNTFADRPGVQVKYLSPRPMDCPDAITPDNVAALAARGVPVWYDDPAVAIMLPAGQWDSTEVDAVRESLAGWLAKYDHHLFLMAHSGDGMSALPATLPPEVRAALGGTSPAVAALGTGRWAGVQRVRTNPGTAKIEVRSDVLVLRNEPHVWLLARASGAGSNGPVPESCIKLHSDTVARAPGGSIAVAVMNPESGLLVDAGTFQGDQISTVWALRKLSLRPASVPPLAR